MASKRTRVIDEDSLGAELERLANITFEAIAKKTATEIYNRGKAAGGTPVDTGELRISLTQSESSGAFEVGYSKDYAPHVEYGHRTVNGGYVQGQNFLSKNVEKQRSTLKDDLINHLRG